jgi:hypothetical protein
VGYKKFPGPDLPGEHDGCYRPGLYHLLQLSHVTLIIVALYGGQPEHIPILGKEKLLSTYTRNINTFHDPPLYFKII